MTSQTDRQPLLPAIFLPAITAALWALVFAPSASDALLGKGMDQLIGGAIGCTLGAAICLALPGALQRLPAINRALLPGMLIFGASMVAILWYIATKLILLPLGTPAPLSAFTASLVFIAWAIAWLATSLRAHPTPALEGSPDHLWIPTRTGKVRIAIADLTLVIAERDYVRLHIRDGHDYLLRSPMHRLLARLDPADFVRVHRSAIVNLRQVRAIDRAGRGGALTLADGSTVAVSRRFMASLASKLALSAAPL